MWNHEEILFDQPTIDDWRRVEADALEARVDKHGTCRHFFNRGTLWSCWSSGCRFLPDPPDGDDGVLRQALDLMGKPCPSCGRRMSFRALVRCLPEDRSESELWEDLFTLKARLLGVPLDPQSWCELTDVSAALVGKRLFWHPLHDLLFGCMASAKDARYFIAGRELAEGMLAKDVPGELLDIYYLVVSVARRARRQATEQARRR